jgi:hypothetical protein
MPNLLRRNSHSIDMSTSELVSRQILSDIRKTVFHKLIIFCTGDTTPWYLHRFYKTCIVQRSSSERGSGSSSISSASMGQLQSNELPSNIDVSACQDSARHAGIRKQQPEISRQVPLCGSVDVCENRNTCQACDVLCRRDIRMAEMLRSLAGGDGDKIERPW